MSNKNIRKTRYFDGFWFPAIAIIVFCLVQLLVFGYQALILFKMAEEAKNTTQLCAAAIYNQTGTICCICSVTISFAAIVAFLFLFQQRQLKALERDLNEED